MLDGTEAHLGSDAQLVVVDQIIVVLIRRGRDIAQFGIEQVLPLPLLPVIIVGKELEIAQQRVGSLTAIIPVLGDMALAELDGATATRHPPVGLVDDNLGILGLDVAHAFRLEELEHGWPRFRFLLYVVAIGRTGLNLFLGEAHQVQVPDVGGQQGAVHRLVHPLLAGKGHSVYLQGTGHGSFQCPVAELP